MILWKATHGKFTLGQRENCTSTLISMQGHIIYVYEMAIFHTGGLFSYLPHHLDLALEDSVGHSTCMSVLARRRTIMGWLVG